MLAFAVFTVLLCSRGAMAQWDRPTAAKRLVEQWDFEDRAFYLEDLPPHWFRTNPAPRDPPKPGFPHYNRALLSDEFAADGAWSFKLPTRGGSTGIALARGVLPAMPGSDYLITAQVRTEGLQSARARLVVRLSRAALEDPLRPGPAGYENIEGAERASVPVISEGAWTPIAVHLPGHPDAEFLQIELELLQPDQLRTGQAPDHEVESQDFSGAAYFDSIAVFQAPRLRVTTQNTSNIIEFPEEPVLSMDVRDLTGEPLEVEAAVWDMDGAPVDRAHFNANTAGEAIVWTPHIEQFGWYRAVVRAHGPRGDVGVAVTDLLFVEPMPVRKQLDDDHFGMIAEHLEADELSALPDMARKLGVGAVQVAAWGDIQDDATSTRLDAFEQAMEELLERGQHVSFVLGRVPFALAQAARVDAERPGEFIVQDETDWIGSLESTLTRFGERVTRWQLGPTEPDAGFWETRSLEAATKMRTQLSTLVPRPVVTLPWSAVLHPPSDPVAELPDALTLSVPPETSAEALPEYIKLWRELGVEVITAIELPDDDLYGRRAMLLDLARKACSAWHAGAATVAVRAPWSRSVLEDGTPVIAPRAEGLVLRTLSSVLGPLRPAGRLPAPQGVTLLIAEGSESGAIIGWSDTPEPYKLNAYLGDQVITVRDAIGSTHRLPPVEREHEITFGAMPQIIEGVNTDLVRFRAALTIEPQFIEAESRRHELKVHLHNPFQRSLSGRIRFAEPNGWSFQPRVLAFSIPAGEDATVTTSIALGVGEEAGVRDVLAEIDLTGDRRYPTMVVPVALELGLKGVELSASYRFARGRDGKQSRLVVTAAVTNVGTAPLSIEAFIQAPGFRGQSAPISALPPGDSTAKVFLFDDAQRLIGQSVRVGLRETNGSARLNKTIRIQ
ncbi:MAG: hypothetical protein KDA20_13280 [Phycisphaerales bacterium]|nr:hypothetical protein [Phycisphaerales bacterium]